MDYQLLLLIAMIGVVLVVAIRGHRRTWSGHANSAYQRVIGAAAFGLLLLVAGLLGLDLRYSRGWFQGARWVDGPVWWQIGAGTGLLMLARFWARHSTAMRRTSPGSGPRRGHARVNTRDRTPPPRV